LSPVLRAPNTRGVQYLRANGWGSAINGSCAHVDGLRWRRHGKSPIDAARREAQNKMRSLVAVSTDDLTDRRARRPHSRPRLREHLQSDAAPQNDRGW